MCNISTASAEITRRGRAGGKEIIRAPTVAHEEKQHEGHNGEGCGYELCFGGEVGGEGGVEEGVG